MNSKWIEITLGEICHKITDGAHNSPKSVAFGKSMASVKDLTEFGIDLSTARQISNEDYEVLVKQGCKPEIGDVLIAKDGNTALDTACTIKEHLDVVMLSSVAILKPNKGLIEPDFLKFYFRSKTTLEYLKSNFISGAAIPRVVLKDFKKAKIKLPPLDEQKKIIKLLQSLEDIIENNQKINTTLEQLAQTVFKSWFVDFDPVHAKKNALDAGLTNDQAERAAMAVISGICSPDEYAENVTVIEKKLKEKLASIGKEKAEELKATASLFPCQFEESEIGGVPKGWKLKSFEQMVNILNGFAFKASDYSADGTFVLRTKNFNDNNLVERKHDDVYLPDEFLLSHENYLCEELDYHLVMVAASIGKTGMIFKHQLPALRNQNMWCFRPLETFNHKAFCKFALDKLIEKNMAFASGSARAFFVKKDFFEGRCITPSIDLLSVFDSTVLPMLELKGLNLAESNKLSQLRDTLLPKLLAGEINLDNIKLEADK